MRARALLAFIVTTSPECLGAPSWIGKEIPMTLSLYMLLAGSLVAQSPDDGQWTMPGKNNASTRYSGLAEITVANAKALRPVWTFSTGVLAGHEGQPLVVKNTMY